MLWVVFLTSFFRDEHGNEVINKFATGIDTDDVFYTDANGREMIKRIRNYRETYNFTREDTTTANYYPVTSKISLRDEESDIQFAVLNDRAQGGSSLRSGEVELMVKLNVSFDLILIDDF